MGRTKYYLTPGGFDRDVTTGNAAVFLLSGTELGESAEHLNTEGSILPIADTLQICFQDGAASTQWTRSPQVNGQLYVYYNQSNGKITYTSASSVNGSRPCFTLPSTSLVDSGLNLIDE